MSAIVGTLVIVPLAVLLAGASTLLFGFSPRAVITFGETFAAPLGLVVWWLLALVPASIYVTICSRL